MKKISIILLLVSYLMGLNLEQEAFRAYKNKNYKEALRLYTIGAKQKNLKSILMLGIFLEKGIAIKQDYNKAIGLYKLILKETKDVNSLIKQEDAIKRIDIAIVALKRLYSLTNNQKYLLLIDKYNKLKELIKNKNIDKNKQTMPDNFFTMCKSANVVSKEFAKDAANFECSLFEQFPDRMRIFLELRSYKLEALKRGEPTKEIDVKIANVIKPIIKSLEQDIINCYEKAQYNIDIQACNYEFFKKTDNFLFTNNAYKYEQKIYESNTPVKVLTKAQKDRLVDNLIEKFSNEISAKIYYSMIQ